MTELYPWRTVSAEEEQRILLRDVPWSTYVMLNDAVDSPLVHMTYLEGQLEIMTKSSRHEVSKKMIARLIELFCLERDIPLYGYGEMTLRKRKAARGLEPDEWYARGSDKKVPDIALEVIVSTPLVDKLDVYRGLGIREVWVHSKGRFQVFGLRGSRYVRVPASRVIPELDLATVARYLQMPDQHAALRAFRDELRGRPA